MPSGTSADPVIAGRIRFEIDPDLKIETPVLWQGLDLWNRMRGDRAMPSRRDFDPLTIPPRLLPHVVLVDIVREPELRFRWRLIGTHTTRALGRDSTGAWWHELYTPDVLASIGQAPGFVATHARPVRLIGTAPFEARSFMHSEALHCPLSSDGVSVDMDIGFVQFAGVD